MIRSFSAMLDKARSRQRVKIAVAAANDLHVVKALVLAREQGLADAVLVGRREDIEETLHAEGVAGELFEIEHVDGDLVEQSRRAVELVVEGRAQVLMKGLVDTSILLRELLREKRFRTGRAMSIVGLLEVPSYPKLILATDVGMCIEPDLKQKKEITENAVAVARALGIDHPKVAVICAKEKVDAKMPATLDAQMLVEMNQRGELTDCLVGGPFAIDNALSGSAAEHKGIVHPVAGDADILLVPDLVSGNMFYKTLVFLAGAKSAATLVGAGVPVVVTSRADSAESKLHAIAVAALLS